MCWESTNFHAQQRFCCNTHLHPSPQLNPNPNTNNNFKPVSRIRVAHALMFSVISVMLRSAVSPAAPNARIVARPFSVSLVAVFVNFKALRSRKVRVGGKSSQPRVASYKRRSART